MKIYSYRQEPSWSKAKDKLAPELQHGAKQQEEGAGEINQDGKPEGCKETDTVKNKREAWRGLAYVLTTMDHICLDVNQLNGWVKYK